jgi:hypothetical protein
MLTVLSTNNKVMIYRCPMKYSTKLSILWTESKYFTKKIFYANFFFRQDLYISFSIEDYLAPFFRQNTMVVKKNQ